MALRVNLPSHLSRHFLSFVRRPCYTVTLLTHTRPYYVLVANSTNLAFAIVTSCVTSLAMQGLFNLRRAA